MSTAERTAPEVILDCDRAEDLRHLLSTVEDWLLHCGEEARDDLAAFLTGRGWASCGPPQRPVANLVTDLGDQAVALRTALRRATEHRGGVATGPAT